MNPLAARPALLQSLAWFLYLGGWIVLGGLARTLTAGAWAALAWMAMWLALLAAFGRAGPSAWASHPAWLKRWLPLGAAALAARGVASALNGGGLPALGLALPGWAWLTATAWAMARGDGGAPKLGASGRATAALGGAVLLWACAGDIGDLRLSSTRLLWAALVAGAALFGLTPSGLNPGARMAFPARPAHRLAPACGLGCPAPDCAAPGLPLTLASLGMLPMMCSLALWPGLCGGDALPSSAMLGLHLWAMFAPAALLLAARVALTPALVGAFVALLATAAIALWLSAGESKWALPLIPAVAWSLVWAASMRQKRQSTDRLAGAFEAP
jgi:hypothetical protein